MSEKRCGRLGRVLVLGLGKTGESVCRYLCGLPSDRVESVTLYGGAASAPGEATRALEAAGARVVCGTEDVEGTYDLAVASPGIPMDSAFFRAAAAASAEVVGEPEFAYRESPERWVAVTGTNGKTTTTSLVTHLMRASGLDACSVGNIGTLVTDEVARRRDGEWLVAELSSFQLATTRELRPRAAVLLNVTPDHLEWHHTMEAYAAAKERAFANMAAGDLAVVSVDDGWCRAVRDRLVARGVRACELSVTCEPSSDDAAFLRGDELVVRLGGRERTVARRGELLIFGTHNAQNALAACAVALGLGCDPDRVREALLCFSPIEHRIEPCGEHAGVRFVNDSKATNAGSVEKALEAFEPGSVVVLLGGHDKMCDLSSLAERVCERCRVAVCFGEAGPRIHAALDDAAAGRDAAPLVVDAPHMREAFCAAVAQARPGDVVLLSPACSSFDEFSGMAERGRLFKDLVRALGREGE